MKKTSELNIGKKNYKYEKEEFDPELLKKLNIKENIRIGNIIHIPSNYSSKMNKQFNKNSSLMISKYNSFNEIPYNKELLITNIGKDFFDNIYIYSNEVCYKIKEEFKKKMKNLLNHILEYQIINKEKFFPKIIFIDEKYEFIDKLNSLIKNNDKKPELILTQKFINDNKNKSIINIKNEYNKLPYLINWVNEDIIILNMSNFKDFILIEIIDSKGKFYLVKDYKLFNEYYKQYWNNFNLPIIVNILLFYYFISKKYP